MPEDDRAASVKAIAGDILDYLLQHPEAEDSVEGIAHWWLLERYLARNMGHVEQALRLLVAEGALVVRDCHGDAPLYRLASKNPTKKPTE